MLSLAGALPPPASRMASIWKVFLPALVPGSDGAVLTEWHVNGFGRDLDLPDAIKAVVSRVDHGSPVDEEGIVLTNT